MEMKIERFGNKKVRFVEYDGEWWAVLKDIADALNMRSNDIANRLNADMMERLSIDVFNASSNGMKSRGRGDQKTRQMLVVNEYGIYEALYASRKLEARKFRQWSATVMKKLRQSVGLEGYQVLQMTHKDIQDQIDWILDSLYWDPEKKCIMQSVTVQGGDVEQVVFVKED